MDHERHDHEVHDHEMHDHDRGLQFDLQTLVNRRAALGLFAGAGLLGLAACGSGSTPSTAVASSATATASSSTSSSATTASDSVGTVPEETAGPFPADGSNGPNVLTQSGIVRSDIRSSFGSATGLAAGVPLTIALTVQDSTKGGAAFAGAAVYLWHCDSAGRYSLYDDEIGDENYLRGVQAADGDGVVTFSSIFPAAYSGRWPHIHFEVYSSLLTATSAGRIAATSQIALPQTACDTVYATDGYSASLQNMARTSLTSDNVFGDDGGVRQLASVTGTVAAGMTAALTISV